jgi:hypothetical protein
MKRIMLMMVLFPVLFACQKDQDDDNGDGNTKFEELSFFEEEMVGKWSRYHAYDDSYEYWILKADRTGCKWEEPDGGGRIDECTFTYWGLDEENPESDNVFYIIYEGTCTSSRFTSSNEFHYVLDEIWLGGYSNLDMTPSNTSKVCE